MPTIAPAKTIDDVVGQLTDIIDLCRREQNHAGYFPTLYRKITIGVKQQIAAGEYDDAERMAHLDVVFAQRYIDAFYQKRAGNQPTLAWDYAFRQSRKPHPLILQHLLLGVNAHINLDLGIAAAETAPGASITDLHADFLRINALLASFIDEVQADIAAVSPLFGSLDEMFGNLDELVCRFSITKARDAAWDKAVELAYLERARWPEQIAVYDLRTRMLARLICPSYLVPTTQRRVRSAENWDVSSVIDWLS